MSGQTVITKVVVGSFDLQVKVSILLAVKAKRALIVRVSVRNITSLGTKAKTAQHQGTQSFQSLEHTL